MFSPLDVFYAQPIDDHHYLCIAQGDAAHGRIILWQFECSFFQSFVIKRKADALPMEQFYFVARAVDENENIAIAGVAIQVVLYQTRQTVETLAHIGRMDIKMEFIL